MDVPLATYRLQLGPRFHFDDARAVLGYLADLGVEALYLSPVTVSRRDSEHGYDVVDPTRVDPQLGGEAALRTLAAEARGRGLGIVLDVVPNHMAASPENPWWRSLLSDGASSPFAGMFDVDWRAAGPHGSRRLLLPVLGDRYGRELERGTIRPELGADGPAVLCGDRRLPTDPGTWHELLAEASTRASGRSAGELRAIADESRRLGPAALAEPDRVRARLARLLRRRLAAVLAGDGGFAALRDALERLRDDPDRFDDLLRRQPFRLAHWRLGSEIAAYRRFFDIGDLVCLRQEDPRVFRRTHRLYLRLLREGIAAGLRVDHVDGLRDPEGYLRRLHDAARQASGTEPWIIVEKVLCGREELADTWPVAGTTGYEFLASLGRAFVDADGLRRLDGFRRRFTATEATFGDVGDDTRRLVLRTLFAGECRRLAGELLELATDDRVARDLGPAEVEAAIVAVTVGLPVYRTYVRRAPAAGADRARIEVATAAARRRHPELADAIAFLGRVLSHPDDGRRLGFVERWQQLGGPAMAKGIEDCALYRHVTLISLNEVGSEPDPEPEALGIADFHARRARVAVAWPHGMTTTATHDTKRGEDARARLHVLGEVVETWTEAVDRWAELNGACKRVLGDGRSVPEPAMELLLYQTLLGAWPAEGDPDAGFTARVQAYAVKAAREARVATDWHDPDRRYEQALEAFVAALLDGESAAEFLADLRDVVGLVAFHGVQHSLAATVVKAAAPGVPDVYQGAELWDLSMVDPDNRRAVDFACRARLLAEVGTARPSDLLASWHDGRIKLGVTARALAARRRQRRAAEHGSYVPLATLGEHGSDVLAFARQHGDAWLVCIVPVRVRPAPVAQGPRVGERWADTAVELPPAAPLVWRDALSGRRIAAGDGRLRLAAAMAELPVALLEPTT